MERVLNPYLKFLGQPVYHLVRHFVSVLSPNILSCLYAPYNPWNFHIAQKNYQPVFILNYKSRRKIDKKSLEE